jgi:ankyrin repeat protein
MIQTIRPDDPLAVTVVEAIRGGDIDALRRLLRDHPDLAIARIGDDPDNGGARSRTLLHIATDWPGHFPNGPATVAVLAAAGADVNARVPGPHTETPLHWAASSDDVDVLDALIDAGADIEAPGAVIAGGTPLDDAVAFGQWRAARRLVEHGASTAVWHAAALGLLDRVEAHFAGSPLPGPYPWGATSDAPPDERTVAFWCSCHGGQRPVAQYLLGRGARLNWVAVWDGLSPLDAARREGHDELATWLCIHGARAANEVATSHEEDAP